MGSATWAEAKTYASSRATVTSIPLGQVVFVMISCNVSEAQYSLYGLTLIIVHIPCCMQAKVVPGYRQIPALIFTSAAITYTLYNIPKKDGQKSLRVQKEGKITCHNNAQVFLHVTIMCESKNAIHVI